MTLRESRSRRARNVRGATALAACAWLALLLAACSPDEPEGDPAPVPTVPAPTTTVAASSTPAPVAGDPAQARVRLQQVAELRSPVAATAYEDALLIVEQAGIVRILRDGELDPTPFIDVTSEVVSGGEQGLLGIAVSPDNRFVYLNLTNSDENTSIREYPLRDGRADADDGRELLEIEDFAPNHNGGELAFGPDGKLYIATGDGGGQNDDRGNGQRLSTLLGKILRIDPRPVDGRPYGVPADNPFVGREGARPEIWSYGLRNPWRFSFDRVTGDLWIGDVGQNQWEEIDVAPAGEGGQNFGWNVREGLHAFQGGDTKPEGNVDPVLEYGRGDGCTVIGGPVYRGRDIPELNGAYLYGDNCGGWVRAVATKPGGIDGDPVDLGVEAGRMTSFAVDGEGEVYAMSLEGPVYRLVNAG